MELPTFKREVKTRGDELFGSKRDFIFCGHGSKESDDEINRRIEEVFETIKKEGHSRISCGDTVVSGHKWSDGSIDIDVCTSDGRYYLTLPEGCL